MCLVHLFSGKHRLRSGFPVAPLKWAPEKGAGDWCAPLFRMARKLRKASGLSRFFPLDTIVIGCIWWGKAMVNPVKIYPFNQSNDFFCFFCWLSGVFYKCLPSTDIGPLHCNAPSLRATQGPRCIRFLGGMTWRGRQPWSACVELCPMHHGTMWTGSFSMLSQDGTTRLQSSMVFDRFCAHVSWYIWYHLMKCSISHCWLWRHFQGAYVRFVWTVSVGLEASRCGANTVVFLVWAMVHE